MACVELFKALIIDFSALSHHAISSSFMRLGLTLIYLLWYKMRRYYFYIVDVVMRMAGLAKIVVVIHVPWITSV